MTLASTTRRNDYIGNGAVDTYSYTFKIYDETDLLVTVKDTDDVETELTLTTHYTVTGVGESSGGSVALVNGSFDWLDADGDLESGYAITIRRVRAITQETDVRNQGSNFREDIEDEFDKQIMIDQQQQDEIDRSLKFSETSTYDGVSVPDPEAGKVLAWNADADGLENIALTYTSGTFPGTFTAGVDASKAASPSTNDVYIATDTKIVYVCYSAGTWTVATTLSGADASKAASPKVGQVYLATDTGKVYFCFSAGTWTTALTLANTLTMSGAAANFAKGSDIASATTTDIGAATGNFVDITGTTTITGLGTVQAGTHRWVKFSGALTLTHNATSLILPGGASITTAAGDTALFVSLGSGNWRCLFYSKASGQAVVQFTPSSSNALSGSTLQTQVGQTTSLVTCSTAMFLDDTIPQNTEGNEVTTVAIQPSNSSNTLVITVTAPFAHSGSGFLIGAIFQDSTANAIAAGTASLATSGETGLFALQYKMTAGTTSSTTFKLRMGTTSGTVYVNGVPAGTRAFGGVSTASIKVEEIKA